MLNEGALWRPRDYNAGRAAGEEEEKRGSSREPWGESRRARAGLRVSDFILLLIRKQ